MSNYHTFKLLEAAGLPPGVLNVVHGFGPDSAGEFVTTGTITDAWPLVPGQQWRTVLHQRGSGPRLSALNLRTTA